MADNNVLQEAIKALAERLEKTEKFVLENAPDICKQMVAEARINTWFNVGVLTGLALIAASAERFAVGKLIMWYAEEHSRDADCGYWIMAILSGLVMLGLTVGILDNLRCLVVLRNCPKLFLLREFKGLLSPNKEE